MSIHSVGIGRGRHDALAPELRAASDRCGARSQNQPHQADEW